MKKIHSLVFKRKRGSYFNTTTGIRLCSKGIEHFFKRPGAKIRISLSKEFFEYSKPIVFSPLFMCYGNTYPDYPTSCGLYLKRLYNPLSSTQSDHHFHIRIQNIK